MERQRVFFDYDSVRLIPKKGIVESRSSCSTDVVLGKYTFSLPICAANMKSVVNKETCRYFDKNNMFYIMHRFFEKDYIEEQLSFIRYMDNYSKFVSISIGVNKKDKELIDYFNSNPSYIPHYITIDIAHGHSIMMESMLKYIKDKLGNKTFIIAGNICTKEAVIDLENWGADCLKVGIGPGSVCLSSDKTGFGSNGWQLSCIYELSKIAKVPIIADGGIRSHGDISKSIALGANFVMAGSLFAGYDQSAGDLMEINGKSYKDFYGSASVENKIHAKNIEGKKILIEYRGNMDKLLSSLKEDLQSAISYSGGYDLESLKKCDFEVVKG